ncbi:uncharacterized protein LDX57_000080 [Aspergillus melleus]|uniref:uncharacterized protein n=1 Tax=Aspergillus melleus TaxID=138277 RepID=UPI001E8E7E7E|nr:uncharacterized protein LDX57_000080 [Aspergillus melleus]KAH8422323.1 hypothetical protein LDX57_000080 [Aspergillus melleus]
MSQTQGQPERLDVQTYSDVRGQAGAMEMLYMELCLKQNRALVTKDVEIKIHQAQAEFKRTVEEICRRKHLTQPQRENKPGMTPRLMTIFATVLEIFESIQAAKNDQVTAAAHEKLKALLPSIREEIYGEDTHPGVWCPEECHR